MHLAERVETSVAGVVFTKSGTGKAPPPTELAAFLGTDLLGHVPEDHAVPDFQDAGVPVVTNEPDSRASRAYLEIAGRLDERTGRRP
jgi:septum site-determining protein MinD